jgi:ABC-type transport system involved in multi-copper enzyme maturation permease subunit
MIGQTIAIFVDAYRDLNARRLFWVTLILSGMVVAGFATLGVDARGLSIIALHLTPPDPSVIYNIIFQKVVIGFWLTWAATILALISTAGIFPDLISGGSIDLFLAKPIGRARLFLTKYLAGLLFVTLQVLVIAAGSYFVLGWRAHEWKPRLFLAVPIVVCFFSYLYGICVLLGVKTRSTIAALLLTILCWGFFATLDYTEPAVLTFRDAYELQAPNQRDDANFAEASLHRAEKDPNMTAMVPVFRHNAETARSQADSDERTLQWLRFAYRLIYGTKTVTPKTSDTIDYLDSTVFRPDEIDPPERRDRERRMGAAGRSPWLGQGAKQAVVEVQSRSAGWIIGTSLAFEAVIVGAAMWIFCRRDY